MGYVKGYGSYIYKKRLVVFGICWLVEMEEPADTGP